MIIYIERANRHGESTKQLPTEFCELTEQQYLNREGEHYESEWFTETNDLGSLIEGLAEHEQEDIIYWRGTIDNHPRLTIYDGYVE